MSRIDFIIKNITDVNPEFKGKTKSEVVEKLKGYKKLILIKLGTESRQPSPENLFEWQQEFKKFNTKETIFLVLPNMFETETIPLGKL